MQPMDTLSTLLSLGLWVVGGGILLCLVAFFVVFAWLIVKTCVDSVRGQ